MSDDRFEKLVNDHGRDVLNVALRVAGDPETAKDVYQEVFLAIWRRWHSFDGTVNWGPYLYRVTVRKALESVRARGTVADVPEGCERESAASNPDSGLRFTDLQRKLTESLAKLPKRQADVFVLSKIEGLDHSAVAETLHCSQNSVRVLLHRAVKRLAYEMSEYLR
ncbi:MAG: sigma-70 family RNA polymerase sigma factor [Sedimentisphaerales bacterium]|nr:sigma-70 family RNA polymerase sigma factor [Sedimentisphaerales bacterium]